MKLLINLCAHDGIISHYTGVGTIVDRYIQTFNYILNKMSNIEYKLNLITPEYKKDSFGYSYIYEKNHKNIENSKIIQISNGSNGKVNYGTIDDWKKLCENAKEYINNLDFNNYDFTLTDSRTNKERKISSKEAMRYAKLQQIKKEAKNVKQKYNISGDSKDKLAYVDFDIMIVGGKEYVGKEEEW